MLFYARAGKVLMGMDRLSEAARQIRTAPAGRPVIAGHPSAAISVLPGLVCAFLAERPSARVRLPSRNSDGIGRLLPSESCDIGCAQRRVAIPPRDACLGLPNAALAAGLVAPSGRGAGAHAADVCPGCAGLRQSWSAMGARRRGRILRQHAHPRCQRRRVVRGRSRFGERCCAPAPPRAPLRGRHRLRDRRLLRARPRAVGPGPTLSVDAGRQAWPMQCLWQGCRI